MITHNAGMKGRVSENVYNQSKNSETSTTGNNVSLKPIYILILLLFAFQLFLFYWLYACFLNLSARYELSFKNLETHINLYNGEAFVRDKRDLNIQDNSIMKPDETPGVFRYGENETRHMGNDSYLTVEDITHMRQNYSSDDWIWLNKYSRVPLKIMEDFCKVTHEKCPTQKGDAGAKGDPGDKGEKGNTGSSGVDGRLGPKGERGAIGPPGIKGDRGDKGERGWPGLDGRPGIPGEPGLDGVPGRNGKDGISGKDGTPGRDGIPGSPGANGADGSKGERGEQGIQGPIGQTGLPGTKGRQGKPGADGIPGRPGISAQNCSINGTNQILVPPTIIGADPKYFIENITVLEYDNIDLKCSATGFPQPTIVWRRLEGYEDKSTTHQVAVIQGKWGDINLEKPNLQFVNISRKHMGRYMCFAENGIAPAANISYYLNVHFPPYIEIENVFYNVTSGGNVYLQCKIESYPPGVYYWQVDNGTIYEESSGKVQVDYYHVGLYETILQLNFTDVKPEEFGVYYCIGKNRRGITIGNIFVSNDTSGPELPVTDICHKNRVKFGNPGPPDDGQICPECPSCKICGFGYRDLDIRLLPNINQSNAQFVKARKCQLEAIGKAVFHNVWPNQYGSWMRETYAPPNTPNYRDDHYYMTLENCTHCLFVFDNKQSFTNKTFNKMVSLQDPILGNDHVVFNGSFYYATKIDNKIHVNKVDPSSGFLQGSIKLTYCDTNPRNYLYKSENNHVDVMSDENGVWAVCALDKSNNTLVWKFNTTWTFQLERAWNISVKHQDAGDMFIICGILYAVDNVTSPFTRISLALDLYEQKLLDDSTSIQFQNPFNNTTMIAYNYKNTELNTWDDGNMLTYPIKCQNLETEKPHNETGTQANDTEIKPVKKT